MSYDRFFNSKAKQKRVEDKIEKYYNSIDNEKIKEVLDKMPKNEATLKIIEEELSNFLADVPGDTEREQWNNVLSGMKEVEKHMPKK